jgi:hypothetical protein
LDRSQNKYRHCKGIKYNPRFGQNTALQEKMDTTCKSNTMQQITQIDKISTPPKAKGTMEDHYRDFWMCETGTGQQVSQM